VDLVASYADMLQVGTRTCELPLLQRSPPAGRHLCCSRAHELPPKPRGVLMPPVQSPARQPGHRSRRARIRTFENGHQEHPDISAVRRPAAVAPSVIVDPPLRRPPRPWFCRCPGPRSRFGRRRHHLGRPPLSPSPPVHGPQALVDPTCASWPPWPSIVPAGRPDPHPSPAVSPARAPPWPEVLRLSGGLRARPWQFPCHVPPVEPEPRLHAQSSIRPAGRRRSAG